MKKFKVIRTYSMKTWQDFTVEEAETPEEASEKAREYFGNDVQDYSDVVEWQEEVEEVK